jgi:hypothetical protein
MSRTTLSTIIAITVLFAVGNVAAGDFGLGAVVGEPTGINGKVWSNSYSAVDFAMAWSLDNESDFNLHVDYLLHDYGVFNVTRGKLPLYYGIGGRLLDARDTHVGLRGVLGLNYLFARSPVDLFFEIAPVLDVVPETEMDLEGGVGMRFYFR